VDHGLAGLNEGGKVEDAVEGFALAFGGDEKVFKQGPVSQIALDEIDACWEQVAAAVAEVIENHCLMSAFGKQSRDGTTYIPGPSGDQYLHKKAVLVQPL